MDILTFWHTYHEKKMQINFFASEYIVPSAIYLLLMA